MTGVRTNTRRGVASGLVMLATLLMLEGVLSVAGQPSLLRSAAARLGLLSDEQRSTGPGWRGPGRLHPDPRVGFALLPNTVAQVSGGQFRTDALGLRARPAGDVPAGAIRLVVLGASIPFGYGVGDTETLAHQLETQLREARGADAREVAARTVAMGRWSHRNALGFLLDHWDELAPDVVVYLPYENDMSDTDVVHASGYRAPWPDGANPDPWLSVDTDAKRLLMLRAEELFDLGPAELRWDHYGVNALTSDISPESTRRYDENADSIALLARRLEASGGRLLFAQYREDDHNWHLLARLHARGIDSAVVPLFAGTGMPPEFTLGFDPHPNAETQRVMATWIAAELLERGWVDAGVGAALPEVPAAYAAARAPRRTPSERLALSQAARESALARLHDRVDFRDGQGVAQILGGVDPDGLAGTAMLLMLRRAGPRVHVELEALPTRPDLYPLDVQVELDGVPAGTLRIEWGARAEGNFDLPPASDPRTALEVRLRPAQWVVITLRDVPRVASFRPLVVSCAPDASAGAASAGGQRVR